MTESEAFFRSLAQISSEVVTVVGVDGTIRYQTPAIHRVFGWDPAELCGRALADWVHPDDLPRLKPFLDPARKRPPAGPVEFLVRRGDGTWVHTETTVGNLCEDPHVGGFVLSTRDVSERKAEADELRAQAWHDAVTGLANGSRFADRVRHSLARVRRGRGSIAVVYVDLDDFKAVNDTLGHNAGDVLLRAVAGLLRECIRPGDTVARLGGDEFAILVEDAGAGEAERVAARVVALLAAPVAVDDVDVTVHASLGIAESSAEVSAEELVIWADAAMYEAKEHGKGRYEIFRPAMRAAARERSSLRAELEGAVARGELQLEYQPIVEVRSGVVQGAEALMRWVHPTRGTLSPGEFLPLAETSGLILPVGAWVLRTACGDLRRWQLATGRPLRMSVNVSARQLLSPELARHVAGAVDEAGIDPATLTIEVASSATLDDTGGTVERLQELEALGIELAIDDFGAGHFSLAYLRRYPVHLLKIDHAFVAGLGDRPEESAVVASMVALGRALGLRAVAVGVETEAQLRELRRLGCELAQGFHLGPPVGASGFEDLAARPSSHIRVMVVDDERDARLLARLSLETAGDFEVVAEAGDGLAAADLAARHQPDVVLLDLTMPVVDGAAALPGIVAAAPRAKVVFITAGDASDVPGHAAAKAAAVLTKPIGSADLAHQVRELARSG